MKLTSRGRYAIQAMLDIVEHSQGKPVRLKDISQRQTISLFFLEQLFRQLRQAGLVKSVRGPGGGYVLLAEPTAITVDSVLKAVKEVMDYSIKIKIVEPATPQLKGVVALASSLSGSVKSVLEKSLSQLLES